MSDLEAGSAPASDVSIDTGVTTEPTPSSTDTSQLSDDEVLDRALAAGVPAEAKGDQPTAEAKPVESEPQATEQEPAEEPDSPLVEPEALKRVFKANPELRRAYFAEKAYREQFGTVAEAREIRALFPNGSEDARRILQQAELLLAAENAYQEKPAEFLENLRKGSPEAFNKFAQVLPETLYRLDRDTYVSVVAQPAVRSVLTNLANRAVQDGDEELSAAVQAISDRLFGQEAQAPASNDPRFAELDRMKAEAEERRQQMVSDFDVSVRRKFEETLDRAVDETVAKLSPSMSEKALARVKDEITAGVINKLTTNGWLSRQAAVIQRSGRYDAAHLENMVGLLFTHAKPLVAPTVKAVMAEWTNEIVRANEEQRTEGRKSAERKDIGAGQGANPEAKQKQVVRDSEFYRKWSDDDILEKRHLR